MQNLRVEIVWFDSDMLELSMTALSENFSGHANFYVGHDELLNFATSIDRFPRNTDDVREYEFGGPNLPGYGGAKIRLFCKDSKGHSTAAVTIYSNPSDPTDIAETSTVKVDVVPADIDTFVEQIRHMRAQVGDAAVLGDLA